MHIRCPHCHNAIEIVEDSSFRDVECPSCGSHFNLVGNDAPTESGPTKPRKLAHFELIEQLGVGHFGAVWKAKDATLDRFVALKIPRKERLDEEDSEKFFREARAAAQLRHPNIVSVHEVGREGDTIFIVSDLVEGATLADWLRGQPLPAREAAKLCATIADALHAAHEAGVVHRDLKPQNIMMDMVGEPHIMDFGLAKRESGEITITIDGVLLGTPAYMSPEQAAGKGHEADRRSDVYTLGVILFQMLTGEFPFRGEKRMLLVQIQRDEPPSPRKLNSGIPRDLETICLKCLEKSPEKRYVTAATLREDLVRFINGETILARHIGSLARAWRWTKRNPLIAVLSASVVLLLLCGITATSYSTAVAIHNYRLAVESLVDALATTHPHNVGETIDTMARFQNDALPILQRQYSMSAGDRKLRMAYALARFGQTEIGFLVDSVDTAGPGECDNLVASLRCVRTSVRTALRDAANRASNDGNWRLKTRLATVAMHLSDVSIAAEMLRAFPATIASEWDPVERTTYVEQFPKWSGNVERLVDVLTETQDASLQSGMCLAIGSIREASTEERNAWEPLLTEWHESETDSGVHSASAWALRSLGLRVPEVVQGERAGFKWFTTRTGLTMIRIPAGQVHRPKVLGLIRVEQDFWLSDREVTRELYSKFAPDYWSAKGADKRASSGESSSQPMVGVSWYDAVMFCNWLSGAEGLEPCYEKSGKDEIQGIDGTIHSYDGWRIKPEASGYRLPNEHQWEYACRAMTTTNFSFGNDVSQLSQYAVYIANSRGYPELVGSRLCNAWGLFDMHGNVYEWCQDVLQRSPLRVYRGGSWDSSTKYCQSWYPYGFEANHRQDNRGFRVAIVPSGE